MSKNIDSLSWLVGDWQGSLGPMTVEETWYPPRHGSMQMMIRLSNPDSIQMLEYIVVREVADQHGLLLHLRQFSEALELRNSQEMPLIGQEDRSVSFAAGEDASIRRLDYTLRDDGLLQVDVTVSTGDVVTAELARV